MSNLRPVGSVASGISATSPVHTPLNPDWIEDFLFAVRRARAHGDEEGIHRTTGIPVASIQDQLATQGRLRPGLEVALELLARIQARRPDEALRLHQVLADRLRHRVLAVVDCERGDERAAFVRVVAEVGDVARAFTGGALSADARACLDREAAEAIDALTVLRRRLQEAS